MLSNKMKSGFLMLDALLNSRFGETADAAEVAAALDAGAAAGARDNGGETPLRCGAAESEAPATAALLLDRGADTPAQDAGGKIPAAARVIFTEKLSLLTLRCCFSLKQAAHFPLKPDSGYTCRPN